MQKAKLIQCQKFNHCSTFFLSFSSILSIFLFLSILLADKFPNASQTHTKIIFHRVRMKKIFHGEKFSILVFFVSFYFYF